MDPRTNTRLISYRLVPNEDLRRAIDDWASMRAGAAEVRSSAVEGAAEAAGPPAQVGEVQVGEVQVVEGQVVVGQAGEADGRARSDASELGAGLAGLGGSV